MLERKEVSAFQVAITPQGGIMDKEIPTAIDRARSAIEDLEATVAEETVSRVGVVVLRALRRYETVARWCSRNSSDIRLSDLICLFLTPSEFAARDLDSLLVELEYSQPDSTKSFRLTRTKLPGENQQETSTPEGTSDRAVTSNAEQVLDEMVNELAGLIEHLYMTSDLMRAAATGEEQRGCLWRALNEGAPHMAALVQAWADLHLYAEPDEGSNPEAIEAARIDMSSTYNGMTEPHRSECENEDRNITVR